MRLLNSVCAAAAVGFLVGGCAGASASTHSDAPVSRPAATRSARPPTSGVTTRLLTITSALAPFRLSSAVSRPIVYPSGGGLLIVGGLTAADRTTQAILRVDLSGGTVQPAGRLPVPVHDAGGAMVAGRDLLFGGGSTAVTSAVQDVTPGTPPRVVSHLPQPRADLVAISAGNTAYILGGYDGAQGSSEILRTRDGRTFVVVGALPVSVRYPAVALSAGSIWLFGGEHAGKQVGDVQRFDLATGHASVAGQLPRPLAHAGAFTLGGAIFLAGGRTGDTATDSVMLLDPATVTFAPAGHLAAARSDFGVAVEAGVAYLVGGEDPRPRDTVIEIRVRAGGTP